ncbi:MAG: MFS transporter [Chloroflexi bacterium]|nr:MFS transporter [Chloroflexota bacterium]
MEDKKHKRIINAWVTYDWANSAFSTSVMAGFMPIYFQDVAGVNLPGNLATVYWSYIISAALLIAAVLSPVLGAMADIRASKKRYLINFMLLGVSGTVLLYFVGTGEWVKAGLFFIIANVGFSGANVFYDALLPHISRPDELDQVSAKGFALGYLGGGILLAVNLGMILIAGEGQSGLMMRLSFLSVAIWWVAFSIPLWRHIPEPPSRLRPEEMGLNRLVAGFKRLATTYREITKYRQVLIFLAALLLYSDGIGTIIKMGVAYGSEIGINTETLVGVVLAVQFVGIPFSFAFGRLAKRIGAKNAIYLGLLVYAALTVGAPFMSTGLHFWILGMGIAMVQGGTQAITRSLGARMIPKSKSGEFFGFVSVLIKFAGILGPLIFGLVAQIVGNSRPAFFSLVIFFLAGAYLLSKVDVEEGIRVAQAEEAALAAE